MAKKGRQKKTKEEKLEGFECLAYQVVKGLFDLYHETVAKAPKPTTRNARTEGTRTHEEIAGTEEFTAHRNQELSRLRRIGKRLCLKREEISHVIESAYEKVAKSQCST